MTDPGRLKPFSTRLTDRVYREWKKVSWRYRCLPDVLIIGCQKGGTSSLHNYLAQHPRMFEADVKEVHFFDGGLDPAWNKYAEGERLYRSYFPHREAVRAAAGLSFEATPEYMYNPLAPQRMAAMVPAAKLIVLLRDPVERAISNYFHERRRGREKLSIMDALLAEEEHMDAVRASGDYKDTRLIWKAYVTRGLYAEQLDRVFTHYPRERVLILESSDFYANPKQTLAQVFDFLGVENADLDVDLTPVGVGSNRKKVDSEVYDWLRARFVEPNARLEELLGRRFDWGRR